MCAVSTCTQEQIVGGSFKRARITAACHVTPTTARDGCRSHRIAGDVATFGFEKPAVTCVQSCYETIPSTWTGLKGDFPAGHLTRNAPSNPNPRMLSVKDFL
jgi:hypothetical protein